MKRIDLTGELLLQGLPYDCNVIVELPNGQFALIREVYSRGGEIIIAATLNAHEVHAPELFPKKGD